MPSRITVVHLSPAERDTINASAAAAASKKVGDEIAATLKAGDSALRTIGSSRDLTPDAVSEATAALAAKEELLNRLPDGEAKAALLRETQSARGILTEAARMLNAAE